MRNKNALLAGILAGLASPATVAASPDYPKLQGSDMARMRQDIRRIGNDFNVVIKREYVKAKSPRKQPA
ncbi:hypothetical protein [Pusillimonas noertemannii]|uniref:hypothetical protein n=1 Tax=Pusillimonas noertemannii TaxID=305977 RepID=UPI0003666C2A|nr:hypothetical protein [Pusillimonas noertemannii]